MDRKYEFINGQNVDVTTLFDKSVVYVPTAEEVNKAKEGVRKHLNEYFPDLLREEVGIDRMFDADGVFWKENGWLISAMKKHPLYNGNLQIIVKDAPMGRNINIKDIKKFFTFCEDELDKTSKQYHLDGERKLTPVEAREKYKQLEAMKGTAAKLWNVFRREGNIEAKDKAFSVYERINERISRLKEPHWTYEEDQEALGAIRRYILTNKSPVVDEELAKRINKVYGDPRFTVAGQKISKLVGKIGKKTGLNKVVDLRETSFTTQSGEVITRTKDFGWNYEFAKFGDSVNPIETKATAVFSVNPVDFLRMSFGYKWASCMTTDKRNRRGADNNYHGMYCGGTMSYMLDSSTALLYYLPENWEGTNPEWEDKLKRCNFHFGEDKIVQGRVYPDGRDGGELTLATQMRNIVQRLISEMFDAPNYWDIKKGTDHCERYTRSTGEHYKDYLCYSDCTVSLWKRIDGYLNEEPFTIGHESICPECGEVHYAEDNVFCEDCQDPRPYRCADCGERLREDEVYWVDGEPYCADCVVFCEDCEEYVRRDEATHISSIGRWVCDDCLERHYVYCSDVHDYVYEEFVVTTEEGNSYNESSTECYGECSQCGEVHDADQLVYDEVTDEYYCQDCYAELQRLREVDEEARDAV